MTDRVLRPVDTPGARLSIPLLALLLLVSPAPLVAQTEVGDVIGRVTAEGGEALPGVTVTVGTGDESRVAVTDAQGSFRLPNLDPGQHHLTFQLEGFNSVSYPNVHVRAGGETELVVTLPLSTVSEEIMVTSETPILDERKISRGYSEIDLDQLPTARDPWAILESTPGVRPGIGSSSHENAFLIDGVVLGERPFAGGLLDHYDFGFIEDAVQETDVSGVSAEYGRFSGGVVNVISKSGGNEFSGSVRHAFTDEDRGLPQTSEDGDGQPTLELDFDSALGAYCLKDRIWFFGAGREAGEAAPPLGSPGTLPWDGPPDPPDPSDDITDMSIYDADGDGVPDIRTFWVPGCEGGSGVGLATDVPSHLYFGPDGVGPVDFEPWPDPWKDEDTHVFSSNFYLTGLYSVVNGGFQLDPQDGAPPPGSPGDGIFFFGSTGEFRGLPPGSSGAFPDADGDGTGDTFLIEPNDMRRFCPDLIGGFFRFGEGGTLIPDDSVQIECPPEGLAFDVSNFFSTGHELEFGVPYQPPRELEISFDDMIAPRVGFTWDVARHGRSKLYGHYGRFYESVPLNEYTWTWGTYGPLEEDDQRWTLEPGEGFLQDRITSNYWTANQGLRAVLDAPPNPDVQDAGTHFESRLGGELPTGERYAPGGAVLPDESFPILHFVARGGSTGEVFDLEIFHPASGPVPVSGYLAIEPVEADAETRARIEAELAATGGVRETVTATAYCLQFQKAAPPAGTIFRVAGPEKQGAFAPVARALEAADRLREAGLLDPDTNPESYFHSIRQWAVWTLEQGFEAQTFVEAFVEHTKENLSEVGREWTEQIEAVVRNSAEGRWKDVKKVFEEAARGTE